MKRFPAIFILAIFPNATAAFELSDSNSVQIEYMDPTEFQRFFRAGANPPCQDYRAGGLNFGVTGKSGGAIPLGMEFRVF